MTFYAHLTVQNFLFVGKDISDQVLLDSPMRMLASLGNFFEIQPRWALEPSFLVDYVEFIDRPNIDVSLKSHHNIRETQLWLGTSYRKGLTDTLTNNNNAATPYTEAFSQLTAITGVRHKNWTFSYTYTVGVGDSRPLYFHEFNLSETIVEEAEKPVIIIEAENFTTASNDINVGTNEAASGGKYIDAFTSNQFLEYKFDIAEAGDYDVVLHVAVRNRDDSVMDVEINEQINEDFLVAKTGDWNIYEENSIENVPLKKGENRIKLIQKRSLSSEPDKIEIFSKTALNTNNFTINEIIIYPNPSTGIINIKSSIKNLDYQLFNIHGKLIQKNTIQNDRLDFSNFSKGIYFLKLAADNNSIVKKIVID